MGICIPIRWGSLWSNYLSDKEKRLQYRIRMLQPFVFLVMGNVVSEEVKAFMVYSLDYIK